MIVSKKMLVLTLIASFLACTSFNRVSSLSAVDNTTEACIRNVKCQMTNNPLCVRVKNTTHPSIKPLYILALNECEMKYLKCHPGLAAELVSTTACHFGNESHIQNDGARKRIKRHLRSRSGQIGVIEFTSDKMKREDIKKLTEWSANSLEEVEGKIQFAFVVEISRYVEHVLPYIRNSINAVLAMVSNDKSKRIKDMVLSVYVYPDYNGTLMTRTDNPEEFMLSVDDINCMCWNQGDVQCEQSIYQATVESLDRAVPGTHMFVFSNSPPSEDDAHFDVEVTRLAQDNQVEVTYVVTGDCGSPNTPEFQSFYPTAAGTGGQVLRIDQEELKNEFLQYVLHTVMEHDRKIVVSSVYPAKGSDRLRIPFTLTEKDDFVTVTVSGEDCDCVLYNHKNKTMDYSFNVTTTHVKMYKYVAMEPGVFGQAQMFMYKYVAMEPGEYKVRVHPNKFSDKHRDLKAQVLVTVATSGIQMMFKYGFSKFETDTLKNTEAQPAENKPLHIVVAVREPKGFVRIRSVVLLTMDDQVISTYRLIETGKEDVYRTKYPLTIPKLDRMKIKLSGNLRQDLTMKTIERTSTRIIKPYKPSAGAVAVSKGTTSTERPWRKVTEGEDVNLECGLQDVKRVRWSVMKHGETTYRALGSSRPTLVLRSVTTDDAGFYECKPRTDVINGEVSASGYVIELQIEREAVKTSKFTDKLGSWRQFQDSCPSKCPVRDVMVCARCQHGVHRTFMSTCYMRMYQCKKPEEKLELVAHRPCIASAPYLPTSAPRPETHLAYPDDDDAILQFLDRIKLNITNIGTMKKH